MPNAEPISISSATKMVSAVCTCEMSSPVSLASTLACGSASAITMPPEACDSLPFSSAMRSLQLLGLLRGAKLCAQPMELLAELTRGLAGHFGAARGRVPQTLVLHGADIGLHGLHGPVLWDPGQLVLGPFGFGAHVFVGVRLDRALTGGIEPVERSVA